MPELTPDEIKTTPAYSLAEAARYIGAGPSTVHNWFRGKNAILHPASKGRISFLDLVQAHVLQIVRKGYHINMKKVRIAAETLKNLRGSLDFLAHRDFYVDDRHLFIMLDEQLISLSEGGQRVNQEIIKEGLRQIDYGADGFTDRFYPKAHGSVQKDFAISPLVNYGRLHIARLGIGAEAIRTRFVAGESISDIAADYGAQFSEIEEAIRWHDRIAA